jgi:hypothetical protein
MQLLSALSEMQSHWSASKFTGTYTNAKEHSSDFAKYKQTTKRTWVIERQDVTTLFGNVQTKLRTYGLREYVPPKGLALSVSVSDSYVLDELYRSMVFLHPDQDLDDAWRDLLTSEAKRSRAINAEIRQ